MNPFGEGAEDNALIEFAKSVEQRIPLLQKFLPPGFKDFRAGVPADWQSGMFVKIDDWEERKTGDPIKCKAKFGSSANAVNAAAAVSEELGIKVEVIAPHEAGFECDGEEYRHRTMFWEVRFDVLYPVSGEKMAAI